MDDYELVTGKRYVYVFEVVLTGTFYYDRFHFVGSHGVFYRMVRNS